MLTRSFPYERLTKLTRRQLSLFNGISTLWDEASRTRAKTVARELLGSNVTWHAGRAELCELRRLADRVESASAALALRIEPSASALPCSVVVELPNETAESIVDRTLGGEGTPSLTPSLVSVDELSRGALAYVVARVLAALGGGLRLSDLQDLRESRAWLEAGSYAVWPVAITLGTQVLQLRIYVPEQFIENASTHSQPRAPLRELANLPLTLIAGAGRATLPLSAAKTLHVHDVVVLDRSGLVREASGYRGSVQVQLEGSASVVLCRVCETGLEVEAFTRIEELSMTIGHLQDPPTTEAVGPSFTADAPIELTVEIARFSLTLAELQRMQPGEVLVTGRRIGEHVTLRMAGRPFAEGELVDVEGEVGVRVTRFLSEP